MCIKMNMIMRHFKGNWILNEKRKKNNRAGLYRMQKLCSGSKNPIIFSKEKNRF